MDRRELPYIYISMMEGDRAFEALWLDAGSSMGVRASCGSTVTMSKVGKIDQGAAPGSSASSESLSHSSIKLV